MAAAGEVIVILVLILFNGVFALSELAMVSSRKARLQDRVNQGSAGARIALELAEAPDRFLSTVQVGITLVGVLAGAFGGATLARLLSEQFDHIAVLAPYSDALGLGFVVAMITYLSLVFGELVPKHLALRDPEGIASLVAPTMRLLSKIAFPVVRLLSLSTQAVVRLLGAEEDESPPVTEEEIRIMLREGAKAGIFEPTEQTMVESVFLLDDRPISLLMTPHTEIVWLDSNDPPDVIRQKLITSAHSRLPVCDGNLDKVLGIVHAHELLAAYLDGQTLTITDYMRIPIFIPENSPASTAVKTLRQSEEHLIIAIGEHGGVEGIITDHDVLEAIVGDIPSPGEIEDPDVVVRADGSWLLDGMMTAGEVKKLFGIDSLPDEDRHSYHTLAGLVMALLGRIPTTGEVFCWDRFRFEVVDMDGRRIDKVLVERRAGPVETDRVESENCD
jgi:putative hemolysin